jgi:hypothetical protein
MVRCRWSRKAPSPARGFQRAAKRPLRHRYVVAADNNNHRYIPELLRAAADVRFDPEATKIARATGDTRTSRFSPRPEAV